MHSQNTDAIVKLGMLSYVDRQTDHVIFTSHSKHRHNSWVITIQWWLIYRRFNTRLLSYRIIYCLTLFVTKWHTQWNLYSRFSTGMWSKLKFVNIQWIKSRNWDTIDDWYINNLAKNQISAVFHPRVTCRNVPPKFIELCMETPCLCPSKAWFTLVR